MTSKNDEGSAASELLERIITQNKTFIKDCYSLLAVLPQEKRERDKILESTFSIMSGYNLPQTKFRDVLCLHAYLPDYIEETIEISQKIENIAKMQGIGFKDVLLSILEDKGIPIGYSKECSDFTYLVNAVYIIGGMKCFENHDYFCKLAKENHLPKDNEDRKNIVISYGLKGIEEALNAGRDISEELKSELMGECPLPEHGYTNLLELNKKSYLELPKKL